MQPAMDRPTPAQLGKVAVLMGGQSAEREISIRSGEGVLAALKRSGVAAFAFDPAARPLQELVQEGTDRVFIALHGRFGEDGTVQGALELMKIPYTGSGVMASSMAMDKAVTKRLWSTYSLSTPKFVAVSLGSNSSLQPESIVHALGLPLAVKPSCEGSSLGFRRVDQATDLESAIAEAHRLDDTVIVEQFVAGREFTCALLEQTPGDVQALPVIEIVAPEGQYDYQNKYFGNATRYLCPAPIEAAIERDMRALSQAAFRALGCSGWARADLMWAPGSAPTLLEINTSPGMTDHSLVPMAAAQVGMSYDELVLRIAATASLKIGRAS